MRTRVKICGLTRPEDAREAARLGADAIGLVFYPPSPRAVGVAAAQAVLRDLPPFVTVVGLFVDPSEDEVRGVLDQVPLDLLQFHGEEPPEVCACYGRPWIKAIRMREGVDLWRLRRRYAGARALLLDAYQPGVAGGTGIRFDWARIPPGLGGEIILAGGLTPETVAAAIRAVRPYAVDVSGGVESAKGVKDPAKMAAFLREVRQGDGD
jgi:phosphoribosylanthranilate isomerase